jgi:carbon storage regulator
MTRQGRPVKRPGLVLTREEGEDVLIGDDVRIEIIEVSAGRAIMRIVAPRDIAVDRGEVRRRIVREGRRPARSKAS